MTDISADTVGQVIDHLVKSLTDVESAYKKVSEQNTRNRDIVEQVHEILFDSLVTSQKASETVAKIMTVFHDSGYRWAQHNALIVYG